MRLVGSTLAVSAWPVSNDLWPVENDGGIVPVTTFDTSGVKAHVEYQNDPIGWAEDKLGIPRYSIVWSLCSGYYNADGILVHEWDGTPDPLAAAFKAIADWKDVAIESGTGTGKSYGVAILILWFLACFQNAEVYTFAPTEDQLKLYIWKNIQNLWPRFQAHFPTAQLTSLTIRMLGGTNEQWSAHGRAVQLRAGEDVSTRAAGMHAEHMLLVYEEMPGIDKAVTAAGRNTCTAPHNLRIGIGNPNHQLDTLHLMTREPGVVPIRMSSLDHPNIVSRNPSLIPGAIAQKSIDTRREEYGEEDPVYKSRVRGISPEQASNSLIRLDWLRAAAKRYYDREAANTLPREVTGKGVDAANSTHGDRACIVDFSDNVCIRVESFACPDSNALGRQIVQEAKRWSLEAFRIGVDAIGVGAGTVNEARRLGYYVNALYAGGAPLRMMEKNEDGKLIEWSPDVNLFGNLRSQMYWQAREDLRNGVIDVPENMKLWEELVAHTFEDDNKVVKVCSKDLIKDLLGRSPDHSDAFVMANWVRHRTIEVTQPQEQQGKSLGYDFKTGRPRERMTAEQELEKLFNRHGSNVRANRYNTPYRRRWSA